MKRRDALVHGDVVLNQFSVPIFVVDVVLPAKARGYVVVFGEPIGDFSTQGQRLAGLASDVLYVEAPAS
jgi:hypothetical protein